MNTNNTDPEIIPNALKGGVLLLGSLDWEGGEEDPRGVWRKNHLEAERHSVTCLPIRYGRSSGTAAKEGKKAKGRGGEFTMVLWPGEWHGRKTGTAKWAKFISEFAVEGKVMTSGGKAAFQREVEALARAEGIRKDVDQSDNGTMKDKSWSHVSNCRTSGSNIPWGLVALWLNPRLPEKNPIKGMWTSDFGIPPDKDLTPFAGVIDNQGELKLQVERVAR